MPPKRSCVPDVSTLFRCVTVQPGPYTKLGICRIQPPPSWQPPAAFHWRKTLDATPADETEPGTEHDQASPNSADAAEDGDEDASPRGAKARAEGGGAPPNRSYQGPAGARRRLILRRQAPVVLYIASVTTRSLRKPLRILTRVWH